MKNIIFFLIFTLIALSLNQLTRSTDNNQLAKQAFFCCNVGRPNCSDPNYPYTLSTDCGEKNITCACCLEIWNFYNDNPLDKIPCNGLGTYYCIPSSPSY